MESAREYAIMALDDAGNVVSWNSGSQRIFGYTEQEILGKNFALFFTPEQLANGIPGQEMAKARAEGRAEDDRWQVRKDGSYFFASGITMPMRGRNVSGYAKVTRDLTEWKRAEEERQRLEQQVILERARLEQVIRQMPAGILLAEAPSGRLVMGNDYVEKWLRHPFIPAEDIEGYRAYQLYHLDRRPYEPREMPLARSVLTGEPVVDEETYYLRGDGTWAFLLVSSGPIRDAQGNVVAAVCTFNDATERKAAEEERAALLRNEQLARREAEAAMRLRDEFLATVSHELRTPLTAILLWTRILRGGKLAGDADRREALDTIERAADAQSHLVTDLLDVSRMMAGKMRLNLRDVELAGVIRAALDTVRPAAEVKGQTIHLEADPRVDGARVDPDRLQQVVWNLLSNAVKFTQPGGRIEVTLRRTDSLVRIVVADDGPGISADFLPFVFDRFRQAETGTTRLHGGLGLGLTISRQIVEMHGGTIRAESAGLGRGSVFTVELPLGMREATPSDAGDLGARAGPKDASSGAMPAADEHALRGVHVLLLDDEFDTRRGIERVLAGAGAHVTTVANVAEALAAVAPADEGRAPDVLVSDIGMPDEDGYALIRQVRAAEATAGARRRRRLPAAAVTAYARADDRRRALEAGFDEHVPKPIEPAELVAVVTRLAGRAG